MLFTRKIIDISKAKQAFTAIKPESLPFDKLNGTEKNAFDNSIISWQAPLFAHKKRSIAWYILAFSSVLGLFLYGLLADAWTLSFTTVIFVGVYYFYNSNEIPNVEIKISAMGVKIDNKVYPYSMFKTFWIDYIPNKIHELHLIPNNNYKYELTLQFMDQDPAELKQILQDFLPEWVDRRRTLTESIIHLIGL